MTGSPSVGSDSAQGTDLPPSWALTTLGAVTDYGKTVKVEPADIPSGAWVLELEDIEKDSSRILKRLSQSERQSQSTKNRFDPGDVLYGKLRPYLNKVVIADAPGFCTTEIVPVHAGPALEPRYLFHWLKHPAFLKYVGAASHGMSMPRLGTDAGRAAPLVLAPRPEQTRIADQLDTLLARIQACQDRLEAIPALLKRFRKSVLSSALSGQLTAAWRGEQGIGLESWSARTIADVAEVGTGSTPLRSNSNYYAATGTPWVTSAATGRPFIDSADQHVTEAAIAEHRLKLYRPGTLLVAMYGEGKTRGQVTELRIDATINQACAAITVDQRQANPAFVKLVLLSQYEQTRAMAEGGAQPNLNLSKVRGIPLNLPPGPEQVEIVRRVAQLFAFADSIESRVATATIKTRKLPPLTLAKAFRGELVPQDPTDEPASALLAKLKAAQENAAAEPSRRRPKTLGNRPTMSSSDKNSIKAAILKLKADRFSFDELRAHVSGDYESLKVALFELLEESSPVVRQVFDKKAKVMQLVRVRP